MSVNPIPQGYHSVTPSLAIRNAAKAIDYYKQALGAVERFRMNGPGGHVAHAELQIGNSILMLAEAVPAWGNKSPEDLGGSPVSLFLYVEDVDAAFKKAVDAGGTVTMPVADMFWGDRFGKFRDPFGHEWGMATHVEDVSPEDMDRRGKEAMAAMAQGG